jgi:hypothetical protein
MAFVVDIRQENRNLHLMYKALFDLSADRAEFLSRLFSRARPADLGRNTTVQDLFAAYGRVKPDGALHERTIAAIHQRLLHVHKLPLTGEDVAWIDHAFNAFYSDGPDIHYGRSRPEDSPRPSYATLMTLKDIAGESRSYLATEDAFAVVKDLHAKNMIVPVVGDFAGAIALRRIGDYVRQHAAVVTAFYGSNVEVYLTDAKRAAFCGNLATLPHTPRTWFIGGRGIQPLPAKLEGCPGKIRTS